MIKVIFKMTNMISYNEYIRNEIILMIETTENLIKSDLIKGHDMIYRMILSESIKSLRTREFLIYFIQNQKRLVEEQTKQLNKKN